MALPPLQLASLLAPSSDYRAGPLLPSAPSAADLRTLQLLAYFGALPPATHALPGGAEGFLEAAWQVRTRVRVGLASPNPNSNPNPNPNPNLPLPLTAAARAVRLRRARAVRRAPRRGIRVLHARLRHRR